MSQGRMRQYGYSGPLNNFTYVKMKGPNKLIETETEQGKFNVCVVKNDKKFVITARSCIHQIYFSETIFKFTKTIIIEEYFSRWGKLV